MSIEKSQVKYYWIWSPCPHLQEITKQVFVPSWLCPYRSRDVRSSRSTQRIYVSFGWRQFRCRKHLIREEWPDNKALREKANPTERQREEKGDWVFNVSTNYSLEATGLLFVIYNIHWVMGPRPLSTTAVFNYNSFLLISFFFKLEEGYHGTFTQVFLFLSIQRKDRRKMCPCWIVTISTSVVPWKPAWGSILSRK